MKSKDHYSGLPGLKTARQRACSVKIKKNILQSNYTEPVDPWKSNEKILVSNADRPSDCLQSFLIDSEAFSSF